MKTIHVSVSVTLTHAHTPQYHNAYECVCVYMCLTLTQQTNKKQNKIPLQKDLREMFFYKF